MAGFSQSPRAKVAETQLLGENIEAVKPAYIGSVFATVSGSSVATAFATGMAPLGLLLRRT